MARLHEFEGKEILARYGLAIPRGRPITSPEQAADAVQALAGPCVLKIQAWTTGRASLGGVTFADNADQAVEQARRLFEIKVGQFPVTHVLVEERLPIKHELFVSLSIDDRARRPVILLALSGGTGIEARASAVKRLECDPDHGPDPATLRDHIASSALPPESHAGVEKAILAVFTVARSLEARSVEINPLVITPDHRVVAADCRMTVDDYAVFRHPDLGIDIARELDHPPTGLERLAYQIEQDDHRGTFYFAQMNTRAAEGSAGLIGFHGAGGGGSMMSMDAITAQGFTIANFCDTSGNPSPAKVYRAARIILSQPGLIGYFGSGSGVANQEQYWSAYGLAKAFWELDLDIPAVIRLGGNTEDRAVDILQSACKGLSAPVEGYRKMDTPASIAARFASLVQAQQARQPGLAWKPRPARCPGFVGNPASSSFPLKHGRLWIDAEAWRLHGPAIIARAGGLLKDDHGKPSITVAPDIFFLKDSDLIAAEVECRRDGLDGLFVELDLPGLAAGGPG